MSGRGIAGACLLLVMAPIAAGSVELADAAGKYRIAPSSSRITFSIPKAGGGALTGSFRSFSGSIVIDGRDVSRSRVEIAIDPRSVAAGAGRVDDFLKSDAVFNAPPERQITFHSAGVKRTGDTGATVAGPLTARGRTHNETFQVQLGSLEGGRIGFHVTGRILRSRYGMDVGTPIYSNVVDFDMTLTGDRN
jgi:polyisoprenoid-binding protein YceI